MTRSGPPVASCLGQVLLDRVGVPSRPGLTAGVHAFADQLRAAGHSVTVPDLYDGATFDARDDGDAYAQQVGFDTIIERGRLAAEGLPEKIIYAGFSLGVLPAQLLAQTRMAAGRPAPDPCDGRRRIARRGRRSRRRPRSRRDDRERGSSNMCSASSTASISHRAGATLDLDIGSGRAPERSAERREHGIGPLAPQHIDFAEPGDAQGRRPPGTCTSTCRRPGRWRAGPRAARPVSPTRSAASTPVASARAPLPPASGSSSTSPATARAASATPPARTGSRWRRTGPGAAGKPTGLSSRFVLDPDVASGLSVGLVSDPAGGSEGDGEYGGAFWSSLEDRPAGDVDRSDGSSAAPLRPPGSGAALGTHGRGTPALRRVRCPAALPGAGPTAAWVVVGLGGQGLGRRVIDRGAAQAAPGLSGPSICTGCRLTTPSRSSSAAARPRPSWTSSNAPTLPAPDHPRRCWRPERAPTPGSRPPPRVAWAVRSSQLAASALRASRRPSGNLRRGPGWTRS